jgi:dTDP-4-dehydrorhamnose 3,5-epimerase
MIDGLVLTPLKIIEVENGDVLRAMRKDELGEHGFGEAYFSTVHKNVVKGWKLHERMTLNLIVPVGEIRFVLHDSRRESRTSGEFSQVTLSRLNYQRLTIPPGLWFAFQGCSDGPNLLLNIANIIHDPDEARTLDLEQIDFDWSLDQ